MSEAPRYTIFVAQPNAGTVMSCAVESLSHMTARHKIRLQMSGFGDVAHNFNMLWCDCLNGRKEHGLTHFAMLHSDIRISPYWLDTLIEEMDRLDAEVISTIVPIKDTRGLTTTGIRYAGQWGTKRFTMREIMAFPETFSIADVGDPATEHLAINTGAWVCRINTGWADEFPGFTDNYRIRNVGGYRTPDFDSEDWLFSDWLAENKIRTYVTRKPAAYHVGAFEYGNTSSWGSWETEMQAPAKPPTPRLASLPPPGIHIETAKPVAVDSLDHIQPHGTAQDNSFSVAFNRKLFELVPPESLKVLDLGCAGGAFVRSILEAGGFAVGVDGSDFCKVHRRAEWAVIPDYLFTADATEPFQLVNGQPLKFNVITGWEFLEHIPEEKLSGVLQNIVRHAEPGAMFLGSISSHPEPHHQTIKPKQWWVERFSEIGYQDPDLEKHFGPALVRGWDAPDAISFPFCGVITP